MTWRSATLISVLVAILTYEVAGDAAGWIVGLILMVALNLRVIYRDAKEDFGL